MNDVSEDVRRQLIQLLMDKVEQDPYPSTTMLDLIEELLTDDEVQAYAAILMDRVRDEEFPSLDMIKRLSALA